MLAVEVPTDSERDEWRHVFYHGAAFPAMSKMLIYSAFSSHLLHLIFFNSACISAFFSWDCRNTDECRLGLLNIAFTFFFCFLNFVFHKDINNEMILFNFSQKTHGDYIHSLYGYVLVSYQNDFLRVKLKILIFFRGNKLK